MQSRSVNIFLIKLSTPHGALGTDMKVRVISVEKLSLSTPHGALGTGVKHEKHEKGNKLSTPHGALGTRQDLLLLALHHNFQLHTVH